MSIQDILATGYAQTLTNLEPLKKQELFEQSSLPASWGPDTVTISEAARAALQESADASNQEQEEEGAAEEFAAYMDKSRSRTQGGSVEERIKALEDRLNGLQSQLMQVATSDSSDPTRMIQIESLNSQIGSVMAQIAELSAQAADQA